MIKTKKQKKHLYTPLRYPGGKTTLFEYFDSILKLNNWSNMTYVEPYAGGVGAGLSLLILGKVKSLVINDYDPAIYSFWYSILNHTNEFIDLIEKTEISVDEWERQKAIYKEKNAKNKLKLGFATFYLNRTNRSGILNAGPIGGKKQSGDWKIDARYNKKELVRKILLISHYAEDITVLNMDGIEVIQKYANEEDVFLYIDPPYCIKGAELYLNAFTIEHHVNLSNVLHNFKDSKWVLTYDNAEKIVQLYNDFRFESFDLSYSAHHNTKSGSELMIFSNKVSIP